MLPHHLSKCYHATSSLIYTTPHHLSTPHLTTYLHHLSKCYHATSPLIYTTPHHLSTPHLTTYLHHLSTPHLTTYLHHLSTPHLTTYLKAGRLTCRVGGDGSQFDGQWVLHVVVVLHRVVVPATAVEEAAPTQDRTVGQVQPEVGGQLTLLALPANRCNLRAVF